MRQNDIRQYMNMKKFCLNLKIVTCHRTCKVAAKQKHIQKKQKLIEYVQGAAKHIKTVML